MIDPLPFHDMLERSAPIDGQAVDPVSSSDTQASTDMLASAPNDPTADIVEWATKQPSWRQDALRRLAQGAQLSPADQTELLEHIKASVGLIKPPSSPCVPLDRTHIGTARSGDIPRLMSIKDISNVNRLNSKGIALERDGMTVVYGRNGSGKSGYSRILRNACRTRIDDANKLRVLGDVYSSPSAPQSAVIEIETSAGIVPITWKHGTPPCPELLTVAIFDGDAADIYVDKGNQIAFLPFGLALPHKLNGACIELRRKLEDERRQNRAVLDATKVTFETVADTPTQKFYAALSPQTSDAQIDAVAKFGDAERQRLEELTRALSASQATAADLTSLADWVASVAKDAAHVAAAVSDAELQKVEALKTSAIEARRTARLDASSLFGSEPLPGVGSETWRALWLAAAAYAQAEAYSGTDFPSQRDDAVCVLCQQPIDAAAKDRFARFSQYIQGALARAAEAAEKVLAERAAALRTLEVLPGAGWAGRLHQIAKRDATLASALQQLRTGLLERVTYAREIADLMRTPTKVVPLPTLLTASLDACEILLRAEAKAIAAGLDEKQRALLQKEQLELRDVRTLASHVATVKSRRDFLGLDTKYAAAIQQTDTENTTKSANKFIDKHLSDAVIAAFNDERATLQIASLKLGLQRQSGKQDALFRPDIQTVHAKSASHILSEGEQRALALAAFFAEVAVTEGAGAIVLDDPVTSLDRERSQKVAARLALEATRRQVIVFTHDLVFFNELCAAAHESSVPLKSVSVFNAAHGTGTIDPSGLPWMGLPVKKRIGTIRNDFAPLRKLHASEPARYEREVKNLYGRLRDTYERAVEEYIFKDIVRRHVDKIETQKLRYIHVSDTLAERFNAGMTRANTYSHDNPRSASVQSPPPDDFLRDLDDMLQLVQDIEAEHAAAEKRRPSMRPK